MNPIRLLHRIHGPNGLRRSLRVLLFASTILVLLVAGLAVIPVVSPDTGAAVADELRAWLGPQPVAELESLAFQIQDNANQILVRLGFSRPQLTWETGPQNTISSPIPGAPETPGNSGDGFLPAVVAAATPTAQAANSAPAVESDGETDDRLPASRRLPGNSAAALALPTPTAPAVTTFTALTTTVTWQDFGPTPNGQPVLARAAMQPDLTRPFAQVALVRIDLTQTLLHVVPGTVEPIAARGVAPFARPGVIPGDQAVAGSLIAAFNGGFKAINGAYGMMWNGITILPPQPGLATVALYADGHVRIGDWGRDLTLSPDMVAYRQNCPLLVDGGAINPAVYNENPREWGYTVGNRITTWRSGLGITQDGRYLIYAVGTYVTVDALARSLQLAGAYEAMQLDINGAFTRFVTYHAAAGGALVADKLLYQMAGASNEFLTPYNRDFFYVTVRH